MSRFFDSAPILSWATWFHRKMFSNEIIPPKVFPPLESIQLESPTGIPFSVCTKENATEYSTFLETYFCPAHQSTKLKIPAEYFSTEFETGALVGIEVRSKTNELAGIIFSRAMGYIEQEYTRLITWFCIHPELRKSGLADYLLFGIVKISKPASILWFRNDGMPKSIAPPVWTQEQITRDLKKIQSSRLLRGSYEQFQEKAIRYWKKKNPTGIWIDSTHTIPRLEWYSLSTKLLGKEYTYAILIANLFEYRGEHSTCEVVFWFPVNEEAPKSLEHFILEELISLLPYDRVEAPAFMPHIDSLWQISTPTSWYVYGYDVGTPVVRPILSMAVV